MDKIIQSIITDNISCVFISPHFDDALLSAGGLISALAGKVPLTVVNVFTKGGQRPYTLSARAYLKQTGFDDAEKLYLRRRQEDKAILEKYTVTVYNLDFTDALWRKKHMITPLHSVLSRFLPEFLHIYPTYRFHVIKGTIAPDDAELIKLLIKNLSFIKKDSIVFCPLGIGNHVDHLIVHEVCNKLFLSPIYWMDFPYTENLFKNPHLLQGYSLATYKVSSNKKEKMLKHYKTQYSAMFGNSSRKFPPERFFMPNIYANEK